MWNYYLVIVITFYIKLLKLFMKSSQFSHSLNISWHMSNKSPNCDNQSIEQLKKHKSSTTSNTRLGLFQILILFLFWFCSFNTFYILNPSLQLKWVTKSIQLTLSRHWSRYCDPTLARVRLSVGSSKRVDRRPLRVMAGNEPDEIPLTDSFVPLVMQIAFPLITLIISPSVTTLTFA